MNDFGAAITYLYRFCFWSLSRDVCLYGQLQMQLPFKSTFFSWTLSRYNSFFGGVVQKSKTWFFSDSPVLKKFQQPDGSCNVTTDTQLLLQLFIKQDCHFCKQN